MTSNIPVVNHSNAVLKKAGMFCRAINIQMSGKTNHQRVTLCMHTQTCENNI